VTYEKLRELISPYLDRELDLLQSVEIEAHLTTCPACALLPKRQEALGAVLRDPALVNAPPRSLEGSIRAALRREGPRARRPIWGVLAAAATLAVAFALFCRSSDEPLVSELVAAHVRSQLADHLVDLPSADQNSVKPWFNGRLNSSPPVNNFQGFPLVGGRLDNISQKRVAALVYRRRQDVVNLFVWPRGHLPSGSRAPYPPRV
jgi:anti-sigma factor RsiW